MIYKPVLSFTVNVSFASLKPRTSRHKEVVMSRRFVLFLFAFFFFAGLIAPGSATAGLSTERRCLSQKVLILGKYSQCVLRQQSILIKRGDLDKYGIQIVKCHAKFQYLNYKVEERAGKKGADCSLGPTTDEERREFLIDALIGVVDTFPDVE